MTREYVETNHLESQISFPMYACSREMIKLYKPFLDPLDLTYTQYITMMALWDERVMTVKTLGERLYLDSGTLTPLLKKLEQKGLVNRKRSSEDERNLIVTITAGGEALRKKAASIPGEIVRLLRMDEEECTRLCAQLNEILRRIENPEM